MLPGQTLPERAAGAAARFTQAVGLHRLGKLREADALLSEVLSADSRHAGAWHLRGLMALQSGDAARGVDWIEHSLSIDPQQPAAHLNIGNYLLSQEQPELALASFERALRLKSEYPVALFNRGNALRHLGRLEEALASYDESLRLQSGNWRAVTNRGMVLLELKRVDEALGAFRLALQLEPGAVQAHKNLGAALLKLALPEQALNCFERLCTLATNDPEVWCGRGNALLAMKRPEDAIASYTRALGLNPELIDALVNRASAWQAIRHPAEALRDSDRALRIAPRSALAHNNAGSALLDMGRLQAALARYEEALLLEPEGVMPLYNRGIVLRKLARYRESAQCFADLLRVAPEQDYALGYLFQLRMDSCDWSDYGMLLEGILEGLAAGKRVINPMSMLMIDSASLQRASAEVFASDRYPQGGSLEACPAREAATDARIRIAYISADFREHPVPYLLVGALELHDRERFEVIGISLAAAEDGTFAERVRSAFDQFVEVTGRSDREVALLLREMRVDVAVDLMGFTDGNRLGIFAHRAAPVQVSYLGYAGTLGAPYMDYLLADRLAIPEGRDNDFREHIVRMPDCFLPLDGLRELPARMSRRDAGLPASGFVFCAFTNPCKINPPVFESWMRLLREVPGSILWLRSISAESRANLEREAERLGIERDRLVLAVRTVGMTEHLARLTSADLFLDTFPYNAHSTACDALLAGVPMVTCAGESFASRIAASALTAAGLTELITQSPAEYELKALYLARHPHALSALRARLAANRMSAPLFDTRRITRHLEEAYRTMHDRALRGEATAAFTVSALPT
jgi:predicted O-linked N-acetylglucosamine transferase (SPINDLY family)